MELTLDFTDIEKHQVYMDKMKKYAIPSVVKGVLNDISFDVKKRTMPMSARKNFISRTTNDNFFRANSKHISARGKIISSMASQTMFIESKLRLGANRNRAVEDLVAQEEGGEIKKKAFIPMVAARTGNDLNRMVASRNRLSNMDDFVDANSKRINQYNVSKSKRFMRAAYTAASEKKLFISPFENSDGSRTVYLPTITSKKGVLKNKALYTVKSKRTVEVKPTHFLMEAAQESMKNAHEYMSKRLDYWWDKKGI